jgi:hypothetical protein
MLIDRPDHLLCNATVVPLEGDLLTRILQRNLEVTSRGQFVIVLGVLKLALIAQLRFETAHMPRHSLSLGVVPIKNVVQLYRILFSYSNYGVLKVAVIGLRFERDLTQVSKS